MSSAAIEAAVKWWTDTISSRVRHDAGDGLVNFVLREMSGGPLSGDQSKVFADTLRELLVARFATTDYVSLRVDYDPEDLLREAHRRAAPSSCGHPFPVKTRMSVEHDYVTVGAGYRARPVRIYGEPRWRTELQSGDYSGWMTFDCGADEAEARRLFAMGSDAATAVGCGHVQLLLDGATVDEHRMQDAA